VRVETPSVPPTTEPQVPKTAAQPKTARTSAAPSAPVISVLAPVYNEVDCLEELHRRVTEVMEGMGETWELVLVDDGSTDGSTDALRRLSERDPHVVAVILSRNFGHQIAVTAGLDEARGQAVVVIDADLQDPPELIPELVARWREGDQVVAAVRRKRDGETKFKTATASIFYRLLRRISDVEVTLDAGDCRLYDRRVVDALGDMRERHRFLRGLTSWTGFKHGEVEYDRPARFAGETKYTLRKMLRLALSAVTGFSYVPLQLATMAGGIIAALSLALIPIVIALRIAGVEGLGGQTTVLIAVLFLGGVQLLSVGILGEYVGRIYDEVKGRPLYLVAERVEHPTIDLRG
jgi:polyisoprenyl-phosphate glycosyltransferase